MTYPMDWTWKFCLYLLAGVGLVAAVGSALELTGAVQKGSLIGEASVVELGVALIVGVGLQPFAWTGLAHARIRLLEDRLEFLRFGLICGTATVPLGAIERFGSGQQRASSGGRERILLLDLGVEGVRRIKLSMYRGGRGLLGELESRLGRPPSEVIRSWKGLEFAE